MNEDRPGRQSGSPWSGPRGLVGLLLATALATCTTDRPTGPGVAGRGYLAIRPVLASPVDVAALGLTIDHLRVAAIRPPPAADTVVDTTVFFDPNAASLALALPVPLRSSTETFFVLLELRAGGRVLFSGLDTVQVSAGAPDTSSTATVTLKYTGPGAGLTHLHVTPVDTVVLEGGAQPFSVSADSSGVPVDSFYVGWSTSDTAAVHIDALGVVHAPGARAVVFVRAVAPNGVRDSTRVTIVPVPAAVAAAGGSGQTGAVATPLPLPLRVRVTAADQLGVKGVVVRFQAVSGGGTVRDSVVVTDSGGFAEDSATLGSTAGPQTFTATATGLPAATFTATAVAGPISAATSTLNASSASIASGSAATLTLQAKDAFGNALATGGATVVFSASGGTSTGTIGGVTDHGDGTYTASFVGVTAGSATTIGATVNGTALTATLPTITVTPGAISATTSTVTVSSATVASGAAVTLTLQARDAAGNALGTGGAAVAFTATGGTSTGTIGPTTDHGDGTYTATFTGALAGTATTIGATVNGTAVGSALPSVTVTAGAASAATSLVSTSSGTVSSGASVTLTLTARDAAGNELTTGGAVVAFTATGGTSTGAIGATTDHGDGTYTATFTGGVAGTATAIGATIDGAATTSTTAVTVVPGNSVGAQSIVSVSAATAVSGGVVTLTLQARDSVGNAITTGGSTVVFNHSGGTSTGTIGPTSDHGDGTYTALFTADTAGTATTIGATIDGAPVTSTLPTITVTPGAISAATSLVTVSAGTVAAGGTVTITLQARDPAGNDLTTGGSTVAFNASGGTSAGTIGAVTDHGDGTYTAIFTAATAGTATTIGATIDGTAVTSSLPTITVTAGAISASTSVVGVSPDTVASGSAATLTLQAKDAAGNPLTTGGASVVFTDSGGTSTGTIAPAPATDNGDGTYTATFTGVLAGTATSILATVNGTPVATARPTITVTPGAVAAATSVVTVWDSTVAVAAADTLYLQAKDAAGNALTTGGATVAFTQSGGTSVGAIGPTTDLGTGTYRALFTGQTAGTPTTIGATIGGTAVTSTPLPTIRVFATSTTHSADITADETWSAAQSPHIVTAYLRVRNGATLTVAAGAVVKFDAGAGLQVGDTALGESGGLLLDGGAGAITLTANTASPVPGYWRGIELQRTLAVAPWTNVLLEWGGGTRPPAGAVAAEACLLMVNNSGAALVVDSLHIRQCNHAGIHHFGGDLTVRRSEIDSATGSGIHEDFKATLELDTSRVVGSGQEGLLVASAVARIRGMAGNVFIGNGIAGIHLFAHQLRGFKQQDSIAANGLLGGGFGDSIVVDSGLVDGGGVAFTLHRQAAPYLFTGPVKVVNATLNLSRGFTGVFATGAGFQVGDTLPGGDAQLVSEGTADSEVVLRARPGTAGWPGLFLGRHTAAPSLHHLRIVGGGYDPAASLTANLIVASAGGAGPMALDSLTSDSSRGHGIAIVSAPGSGFRVRDDSIRNSAGIGLFILAGGTGADTVAGNALSGNHYGLGLGAVNLAGLGANAVGASVVDTLFLGGGRVTANATLPHFAGAVWRATGQVVVDSGAVLTIAPLDTVAFDTGAGITVGQTTPAALAADGTAGPILFTASDPFGGWHGIDFHTMQGSGTATSNVFNYVDVDRAGYSTPCFGDCSPHQFGALRFTDSLVPTAANLATDHVIVRRSRSYALDFQRGGTGTVSFTNSQFYDNLPDPMIRTRPGHGAQLTIATSDLYHYRGQAINGIYKSADPADSVTATNNWWGDVAGVDTGFNFQDSLGRASIVFGAVHTVPVATTAFFPVGPAAGVITTQDSVLSPAPSIGTADSIRVRVVDAFGRGVPGQPVTWTLQPASGSGVSPASGSGDPGGRVDALWSFTTTAGGYVATATGPAGAGRYYADVQPGLTTSGPNWGMIPALTEGTTTLGAKAVTFSSTNRRGVLVSNSVDQYGNATHPSSICFADVNGACQFTYGVVDSTRSGTTAGDTIFFHASTNLPATFVLRGFYTLATGGQKQDSIAITMASNAVGVRIDRDQFTSGVQTVPDTARFVSICPSGQPNGYCQQEFHAFVVDSGMQPVGNGNAQFQWNVLPATGAPVSFTTRGAPANDTATVTAIADGFARLVVQDASGNNFGSDTLPIVVQQQAYYIVVSPDTASVLIGGTATYTGAAVDPGGDTLAAAQVHWRPYDPLSTHYTIIDTSVANQVTVRLDSTPFGSDYVEAFAVDAAGDSAFGTAQITNPVFKPIPVALQPWAIAVDPATHSVYAGHQGGQLYQLDGSTDAVVDSASPGLTIAAVAVNPVTHRVYATTDQGMAVLEGGTLNPITVIPTGTTQRGVTNLQGLTVDSVNNRIYVTADIGAAAARPVLRLVDGQGDSVVTGSDVVLPALGTGAAFDPANGLVYVAIPDSDLIVVVDPATDSITGRITVGTTPTYVAVNPVTNRVYVANSGSTDLSVIDAASGAVIQTVPLLYSLGAVAVDVAHNRVYVGATSPYPYLLVVDGATNRWDGTMLAGDGSFADGIRGVAVDGAIGNGKIFTANYTSGTVARLEF